jgi:hypothetical protein
MQPAEWRADSFDSVDLGEVEATILATTDLAFGDHMVAVKFLDLDDPLRPPIRLIVIGDVAQLVIQKCSTQAI